MYIKVIEAHKTGGSLAAVRVDAAPLNVALPTGRRASPFCRCTNKCMRA
jgi:hypothetical protein